MILTEKQIEYIFEYINTDIYSSLSQFNNNYEKGVKQAGLFYKEKLPELGVVLSEIKARLSLMNTDKLNNIINMLIEETDYMNKITSMFMNFVASLQTDRDESKVEIVEE
jgi:hypothetical protein